MAYTPTPRTIDYIEISSTDLDASQRFFEALFGWKFTSYGPDYLAFDDGRLNGGFAKVASADEILAGSVLVVFFSDNIHETLKKVEDLGGKIVQQIFEFPGGRRFHFQGPDDIEYAVWAL